MQIADKYAPQQIESKWYDYWIEQHIFHSETDQREPYTSGTPPCPPTPASSGRWWDGRSR